MQISDAKWMVVRAVQSTKNPDTAYLDVIDMDASGGGGRPFQISSKHFNAEQLRGILFQPVSVTGQLYFDSWQGNVKLTLGQATLKRLGEK